jgi:AP2 domain
MADAATATAQDFTTPDRSSLLHRHFEEKKDEAAESIGIQGGASLTTTKDHLPPTVTPAATVTPSEKASEEESHDAASADDDNRQVRFDKEGGEVESTTSSVGGDSPSKRGLVSRRGRGSPGRALMASSTTEAHEAATTVLEFKTFRSPERKQKDDDAVPSLCSTGSVDRKEEDSKQTGNKDDDDDNNNNKNAEKDENCSASVVAVKGYTKASSAAATNVSKKGSVTFSPVPPPHASDKHPKTPIRSPAGGRLGGLPNLYDAPLGSPGAIFLSPTTPTRAKLAGDSASGRPPLTPRTPRDRLLTTPTDFAFDYGKHPMSGSLLDNSNVLSWLHSPSANGLFSPGGGLGSMMNTPKGGAPRTPHTPTVTSTSFFFSDVAGLPKGSEFSSPNKKEKREGRGNSMICISPLSSLKAKNGAHSTLSPKSPKLNMDMFASPAERSGMAKLGMKTTGGRGDSLGPVHLEDRDFMEDDDLSRLLQIASNTPRPSAPPAAVSTSSGTNASRPQGEAQKAAGGSLPVLSLPTIGGDNGNANASKLMRKTQSRDMGDASAAPRPAATPVVSASNAGVTPAVALSSDANAKKPAVHAGMNPFMTSYHHHEAAYNPSLYPGISHGGSMRVVVGGPPRTKSGTPPGTIRYTVGRPGEFPAHYPPAHYPSHHGVPPHMHHQYAHYPPPASHHGAPRHAPLYSPETQAAAAAPKKKPAAKAGTKRPAPAPVPKQTPQPKKPKKQAPSGSQKKKNRSPQLVDKAERQKAAATIQAVNQASGGKNDKAAALAAAILRGVTMRPSGKWQAQLYFAGKSRYIGVFDTREKAALAYEIARERLKVEKNADGGALSPKQTENAVNAARKAAFDGVNERGL